MGKLACKLRGRLGILFTYENVRKFYQYGNTKKIRRFKNHHFYYLSITLISTGKENLCFVAVHEFDEDQSIFQYSQKIIRIF